MGFEINWSPPRDEQFKLNQFYLKYNTKPIGTINLPEVKTDLEGVLPTAENVNVIAYLCWLIRCKNLILL